MKNLTVFRAWNFFLHLDFFFNSTLSQWGCLTLFYYSQRIKLQRVLFHHGNKSTPKRAFAKIPSVKGGEVLGSKDSRSEKES